MKPVVRFSLKQRVFYNLVFVVLIAAGALALLGVPVERYPNVNFGEVIIDTYFPGASPTEVETLVTTEIEDAIENVEDIEWIRSTSFPQQSRVHLKFIDDSDYEALYDDVRFKVLSMLDELPPEVDPPAISSLKVDEFLPVIVVNVTGERENRALALMAEEIQTAIRQIDGVKEAKIAGEYEREFHVFANPERMRALGVTFDDVATALQRANISVPAGDFANPSGEFVVKVDEKFRSREEVLSAIIRRDGDGSYVRVADVASDARPAYRDPQVISTVNGQPSVAVQVIKSEDGNALDIRANVIRILEDFEATFAREGVDLVLTQDSTIHITDALTTLGVNMGVGIVLVCLIIWYFMGLRNAALTTIGIPFSFMVTMVLVYLTGNTLNQVSLFAFVLVTGIIVDDAIVVVENIYRHVQEGGGLQDAIVTGTSEVALPVLSATSTTVAAFLPMLIMTGTTGEFFAQIPIAVSFAIAASLIECLLILPVHYLDWGPRPLATTAAPAGAAGSGQHDDGRLDHTGPQPHDNVAMRLLRAATERVIQLTLRHRVKTLLGVVVLFGASLAILGLSVSGKVPLIQIKFFPDDYTLYYVDLEGPATTPIEETSGRLADLSRFIMADGPGMAQSTTAFAGFYFNDQYEEVYGSHLGTVMVALPARDRQEFDNPAAHLEDVRTRVKARYEKDGFKVRVHAQKDGPPTGKDLTVRVLGSHFPAIEALADRLLAFLETDPGIAPHLVEIEDDRGRPDRVFRFDVDQQRAREYDFSTADVAMLAGSVLDGRYVGKFRLPDEEVDLKLKVDPAYLLNPEDALDLPLLEHPSGPVRLGDLVSVRTYMEPGSLRRYQGRRVITLLANIRSGAPVSTPTIVKRVREYYEDIRTAYPGVTLSFAGAHAATQRSYTSLTYAFGIAVLIMYMILATQFQSYMQPLIILSSIVFALIGVVFGKLITQSLFTVNSFVAVIGVAGVVVNDSLVLIDFINKRYRAGMPRRQAIEEGIRIRLRPIVLTTLTTTLGLLPMALGIPYYSLVWGTMAATFVTGLAAATALTLFIVPVQWDLLEALELRLKNRRSTGRLRKATPARSG